MNWSEISPEWIEQNKELLLDFFIKEVIPRFYSDKVLERFKSYNIDDIYIGAYGNGSNQPYIKIREIGKNNPDYYIVGRHVDLYELYNYKRRLKREDDLKTLLNG